MFTDFAPLVLVFSLLLFIVLSIPIPFAIGLSSLIFLLSHEYLSIYLLAQRTIAGLNSFLLLSIPLFLLTGLIMNESGITDRLINFSNSLVGRFKGGLAYVNIVVSMFFAGISGSSNADTAGIGSLLIPAMIKKGYSKEMSVVVTAASATLGTVIPPSVIALIYAATAGISVGGLFLAGIVPGILITVAQMGLAFIYAVKYNYGKEEGKTFKEFIVYLKEVLLPMFTPIIILYGVIGGKFTVTEAAAVAATYSILLGVFVYKTITLNKLLKILEDAVKLSGPVLFCVAISSVFGYIVAIAKIPDIIKNFLYMNVNSQIGFLLIIFIIFLVVGCFMDATPSILILVPIVAPIGYQFGVNPIHLGIVIVMTMSLGLITPPYGLSLLLASSIAHIPVEKTLKILIPFVLVMALVILFCILFPDVILYIPRLIAPRLVP